MSTTTPAGPSATAQDADIRSFRIDVPEEDLVDLRARVAATRWPDKETDPSQGVRLETIQKLARHWATAYDWRRCEVRLNALPQFITEIDGLDIHFIHVRSKHENALPIVVTHGWPGSIIEQLKIIGPLTDPESHGGTAADAFDVVIPSMPGFGFSGKPSVPGWGPDRMARAWVELMRRLGYTKYVATGGDWGGLITDLVGLEAPPELAGIHTNFPGAVPPEVEGAAVTGSPLTDGLSPEEREQSEKLVVVYQHVYYAFLMATRPQTLLALADSPVGLASFMIDHDATSYELIARAIAGEPEGLTPDDILDNVTLFWLTNTAISAARIYWENKFAFFSAKGVTVPVAVSVFPDELYQPPRSWAEKAYPNLIHYNALEKGGHFAAWEQPQLLTEELRTAFRSLR